MAVCPFFMSSDPSRAARIKNCEPLTNRVLCRKIVSDETVSNETVFGGEVR